MVRPDQHLAVSIRSILDHEANMTPTFRQVLEHWHKLAKEAGGLIDDMENQLVQPPEETNVERFHHFTPFLVTQDGEQVQRKTEDGA